MATIEPTGAQLAALDALPGDAAIHMLNLLRFRPTAAYPAEHPDHGGTVTGRAAYRRYAAAVVEHLARVGARIVWSGRASAVVIGPAEGWDAALIVEYPSAAAFLRMVADRNYQEVAVHRSAALADSRLLCLTRMPLDDALRP